MVAEDTGARRTRGPSPQKTTQTRLAVTRAALELFLANGYRSTRISDVAARAGVAKGTVYLYFPDKQALFAGVLGEVLDQRVTALSAAEPADDERVRDFLQRTLLPHLADLGNHSPWLGLLRLVMTEGREAPEIARLHRERVLDPLAAQIQKWAQIATARGEINGDAPPTDPAAVAITGDTRHPVERALSRGPDECRSRLRGLPGSGFRGGVAGMISSDCRRKFARQWPSSNLRTAISVGVRVPWHRR